MMFLANLSTIGIQSIYAEFTHFTPVDPTFLAIKDQGHVVVLDYIASLWLKLVEKINALVMCVLIPFN